MKFPILLLALSFTAAHASGDAFDAAWQATAAQPMAEDHPYLAALDAYYASEKFDAERCDLGLQGEQSARLLLDFDSHGKLSIRHRATSEELALCLSRMFYANPPPTPPQLPMSLPYAFKRADPVASAFDADWQAATDAIGKIDDVYKKELQDYFASDTLGDEGCEEALHEDHGARLLLEFDRHGGFTIRSDSANTDVLSCLSDVFTASTPPTPAKLPLAIPFWFQRS